MFEKRSRPGIVPMVTLIMSICYSVGCTSCNNKTKATKTSTARDAKQTATEERALTNEQIAKKIENSLKRDAAVDAAALSVAVTDGIATLEGKQSNYTSKLRAELIAETVRGVRSVVNQIEVVPTVALSNEEIKQSITNTLAFSPTTESYEIEVAVTNGIVTLTGTVDSWQERALAERLAMNVRGVTGFVNSIKVEYDEERPDYEIKQDIQAAFTWDALLHDEKIEASVDNGTVTLKGTVPSAAEKRRAVWDARVAGVETVNAEDLEVDFWDATDGKYQQASFDDAKIERAVEDAMLFDPRVNSMNVKTRVKEGIVYLRGTVDDLMAKRAAENDAENTTGVIYVKNLLKIRPGEDVEDETVSTRVQQSLMVDPYIEKEEIKVSVKDGTVRLEGTVDSLFEKSRAEMAASRVTGATEVKNALNIKDTGQGVLVSDPYLADVYTISYYWVDAAPEKPDMSDKEIAENIRDEMWWSPYVTSEEVKVNVDEGVAKLEGKVDSWSERRAAVRAAFEGGAQRVVNNISVGST